MAGAPIENTNAEKWTKLLNNKKEFNNEKEYQDYIELNIRLFCKDVLELGDYVSHKTNKSIQKNFFSNTTERADF